VKTFFSVKNMSLAMALLRGFLAMVLFSWNGPVGTKVKDRIERLRPDVANAEEIARDLDRAQNLAWYIGFLMVLAIDDECRRAYAKCALFIAYAAIDWYLWLFLYSRSKRGFDAARVLKLAGVASLACLACVLPYGPPMIVLFFCVYKLLKVDRAISGIGYVPNDGSALSEVFRRFAVSQDPAR